MSFIRRYGSFPSSQVINQIEGVVIVDLPPPSTIEGVSTGVVGVVGEFADFTYAVNVDGQGNVTTKPQPVEVTSAQDMVNKVGGFDATLGDFGGDDGSGFATVANKRFSRLVICPVNLASSKGTRLWRELPTNTVNAAPVVPMQAVTVAAGTEFKSGANRVKLGKQFTFTGDIAYLSRTTGQQNASGSGAQAVFQDAGGDFVNRGVKVGDALVVGIIGTSTDPGTYRIIGVTATTLTVEALDGADFTWTGESALPYRVHPAASFDSGDGLYDDVTNYLLPARPLDATITQGSALAATDAAPAATENTWSPLSGLTLAIMPGVGNDLVYTAAVQAPNALTNSTLEALYTTAFESLLADAYPARDISILVAARTSNNIRSEMKQHVLSASSQGKGRMAVLAPAVSMVTESIALGDAAPGVGATRDERVIYCWPGVQTSITDTVGTSLKLANGTYNRGSGIVDVRADAFMASILSNLAAERNPGQATDPVPLCLSPVLGFQSGLPNDFSMTDYILFRQNGIAAIRFDRTAGTVFQSGITTALSSGQKNINRRRMADEIQDSLAAIYERFSKLPLTVALKDAINAETVAYLSNLVSLNNPAAQRIAAYSVDSKSGNTPQLNAAGIYVVIVRVQMLATADVIVLQAEVGPNVNISTT